MPVNPVTVSDESGSSNADRSRNILETWNLLRAVRGSIEMSGCYMPAKLLVVPLFQRLIIGVYLIMQWTKLGRVA